MYCLSCDAKTSDEFVNEFGFHFTDMSVDGWTDCYGPFSYCPPPELDMSDEWVDSLPIPTEDELLIMELNAEELARDLEIT